MASNDYNMNHENEKLYPLPKQHSDGGTVTTQVDIPNLTEAEFIEEWKEFLAYNPSKLDIDDNDSDDCQDVFDKPLAPKDEDFASLINPSTNTGPFLPEFLNQTARLDKEYPDVESFRLNNKSAIQDFEKIVTSACKFAHKFTKVLDFGKYFQLLQDEKAISLMWAAFIERFDPSIFAQKCLQAVPI